MLLPSKILRLFVCLCFLSIAAQTAFSQDRDKRKGYEAYVNGLFKAYDQDKDGSLDLKEVEHMRRKPAKEVDANSDGKITKTELVDHYLIKAGLKKAEAQSESNAKAETAKLAGAVKIEVDGESGGLTLMGSKKDVAAVEAMMQKIKALNESKAATSNEKSVSLSIWIVNGAGSIDFDGLKGQSRNSVVSAMEKLASRSTVNVEEMHHDAVIGRSFELTRSGQVPVVQSVQRRGENVSRQTSTFEVGTSLSAKTNRSDGSIMIDFQVEKSIVQDSDIVLEERDDEPVYAKSVQQFKMEAEVECQIESASVVSSIEGDRTWALVFCASSAGEHSDSVSEDVGMESPRKRESRRSSRDRDPESRNRSRRSRD